MVADGDCADSMPTPAALPCGLCFLSNVSFPLSCRSPTGEFLQMEFSFALLFFWSNVFASSSSSSSSSSFFFFFFFFFFFLLPTPREYYDPILVE
jgi:hypothetical protein